VTCSTNSTAATDDARGLLEGRSGTLHYGPSGSGAARECRCSSMSSSRRHDCWCSAPSISLRRWCCSGAFLGYRATACDARCVFTTAARIPAANEVVVNWPHRYLAAEAAAGRVDRRTVVTVLTHDP
jgi:xanthine dehydrogenase accessory factor